MTTEYKLVIDTNVYVSALLNNEGSPAKVFKYATENAELLFSWDTLNELEKVINRPKFERYLSIESISGFLSEMKSRARIVVPTRRHSISPDEKDNKFLDVAVEGKADFIISGDKRHMLSLSRIGNIRIISTSDFLNMDILVITPRIS